MGYNGLCGDYFINHEIRIPFLNNQDSMESIRPFFFSWLTCLTFFLHTLKFPVHHIFGTESVQFYSIYVGNWEVGCSKYIRNSGRSGTFREQFNPPIANFHHVF